MISKEMQDFVKLMREVRATEELSVKAQRDGFNQLANLVSLPQDVKYEAVDAVGGSS